MAVGTYLIVNSHTVSVEQGSAKQASPIRVGATSRAFSGTLRSTVRTEKRSWSFTTIFLTIAQANTLMADLVNGTYVNSYGDALYGSTSGSPVSCQGTVTGTEDKLTGAADGSGVMRKVSFTLAEV